MLATLRAYENTRYQSCSERRSERALFPVLYQNGPFVLYTHDFFTMLGLLAGLMLYYYELRRRDMLDGRIFWISLAAVAGGGIGARLSVVWEHPAYYADIGSVPL